MIESSSSSLCQDRAVFGPFEKENVQCNLQTDVVVSLVLSQAQKSAQRDPCVLRPVVSCPNGILVTDAAVQKQAAIGARFQDHAVLMLVSNVTTRPEVVQHQNKKLRQLESENQDYLLTHTHRTSPVGVLEEREKG